LPVLLVTLAHRHHRLAASGSLIGATCFASDTISSPSANPLITSYFSSVRTPSFTSTASYWPSPFTFHAFPSMIAVLGTISP